MGVIYLFVFKIVNVYNMVHDDDDDDNGDDDGDDIDYHIITSV